MSLLFDDVTKAIAEVLELKQPGINEFFASPTYGHFGVFLKYEPMKRDQRNDKYDMRA